MRHETVDVDAFAEVAEFHVGFDKSSSIKRLGSISNILQRLLYVFLDIIWMNIDGLKSKGSAK